MPVPNSGPISINDISEKMFDTKGKTFSLNPDHVREAARIGPTEPVDLYSYYGLATGMYRNRISTTPRVGYTQRYLTAVYASDFSIEPVNDYAQNNNQNFDPWETVIHSRFTGSANQYCSVNHNFCWLDERGSADYECEVTVGQGGGYGANVSKGGTYLVVNCYQSMWQAGTPTTLLNEQLKSGPASNALRTESFYFTKNTTKPYILISVQTIMPNPQINTDYMEDSFNNLTVREV